MNDTLGIAVLGTGDVSGEHIRAYESNPRVRVRAILSRERARAEAKIAEYGLRDCRAWTDLDDLLKDEAIDAVSICTPHHLHVDQGVACAQAGKHVLIEKPMALDLAGLRSLDRAVRDYDVRSVVGFVLRWNPLYQNIRALLADGMIGSVYHGEVDYLHGIPKTYSGYEWISKRESGGSALLTGGCHAVDGLRWFVQAEAVEVFGYANTSRTNPIGYDYEPNSVTLVQFADGATGKIGCSIEYAAPYTFPIVLMGDGGVIRDNRVFTKRWPGQTGWATIPTIVPDSGAVTHHPFQGEIDHFIDCIRTGTESHSNVADAMKTHEICIAAEISRVERRPVRLPL